LASDEARQLRERASHEHAQIEHLKGAAAERNLMIIGPAHAANIAPDKIY